MVPNRTVHLHRQPDRGELRKGRSKLVGTATTGRCGDRISRLCWKQHRGSTTIILLEGPRTTRRCSVFGSESHEMHPPLHLPPIEKNDRGGGHLNQPIRGASMVVPAPGGASYLCLRGLLCRIAGTYGTDVANWLGRLRRGAAGTVSHGCVGNNTGAALLPFCWRPEQHGGALFLAVASIRLRSLSSLIFPSPLSVHS